MCFLGVCWGFLRDCGGFQVRLDEMALVPLLYPTLRLMFADHYEELEQKAKKRQLKMERMREASRERSSSVEKKIHPNIINIKLNT